MQPRKQSQAEFSSFLWIQRSVMPLIPRYPFRWLFLGVHQIRRFDKSICQSDRPRKWDHWSRFLKFFAWKLILAWSTS
jgi:hypothetical protein